MGLATQLKKVNHMTDICAKCFRIISQCECHQPKTIEIDDSMVDIILCLNRKNYRTEACCGGHPDSEVIDVYIGFKRFYDFQTIPEEFKYKKFSASSIASLLDWVRRSHKIKGDINTAINNAVNNLATWARNLPENPPVQDPQYYYSQTYAYRDFIKYTLGAGLIRGHIEALHAAGRGKDIYTDEIVDNVISSTRCAGIIGLKSRYTADLNRPLDYTGTGISPDNQVRAINEYREAVFNILKFLQLLDDDNHLNKPYLHLSIHGIKDSTHDENTIEIGTCFGSSCSTEVCNWVSNYIKDYFTVREKMVNVLINQKLSGDQSKSSHRKGDLTYQYKGYGDLFNTVQIEIAYSLRKNHRSELTSLLCGMLRDFSSKFIEGNEMLSFDKVYALLQEKGPGKLKVRNNSKYSIEARDGNIIASPGKRLIIMHEDCWENRETCQGTWAGGIYDGPYSIYDWYKDNM